MTIGSDPEVFIFNTVKQKVVSVEGMIKNGIKGTKHDPLKVEEGFYIQEDNVLAEYNIKPCETINDWVESHEFMIDTINMILPDNHICYISSSEILDDEYLKTSQAREAGCESDINLYLEDENEKPDLKNTNLRTAGGHIHVGIDNSDDFNEILKFVKALDLFLGVPSILLDDDTDRRKLYGLAGSFREKPYGFEYRTLSNFWLKTKSLQKWVFNQVHEASKNLNIDFDSLELNKIIDNNDKEKAKQLIKKYNICVESSDTLVSKTAI